MTLSDVIRNSANLTLPAVPELRYLASAVKRVLDRWPDIDTPKNAREREEMALKLRAKVDSDNWENTRLSFVIAAASAIFDPERRERSDFSKTREFLYAEVRASSSETFLAGILRVYLESYTPDVPHTKALSAALLGATAQMGPAGRFPLEAVPELMDAKTGPDKLAARISKMGNPYNDLRSLGIKNPHGAGFMDFAHLALTKSVQPYLSERDRIDWYIRWLRPPGIEEARNTGAERAIEALIYPWLDTTPDDTLRSYLVETLIELYGDPRIKFGGVWAGIDAPYLAIVHRWLTREDMRFFTGVVDAVQKDNMWIKRRDFWLKLYDEGLIDAAWAALSPEAFRYAREHLMRQDAKNAYTRVGFQGARPGTNTSLLILKIGNKIMVDGCHSYRTHVFDAADPMAPKLFEEGYSCEAIMRASDNRAVQASKSHSSIQNWGRWVRDMINADVSFSRRTEPYPRVSRPRPPGSQYASQQRLQNRSYTYGSPRRGAPSGNMPPRPSPAYEPARTTGAPVSRPPVADQRPSVPASNGPVQAAPVKQDHTGSDDTNPLKNRRFSSLTDRMIAYGPDAAMAVLRYFESPSDGKTRPLFSPKSREAIDWVRWESGDMPLRLRNALEHLLISLKTGGVDLDNLFASYKPARSAKPTPQLSSVSSNPTRIPSDPQTLSGEALLDQLVQTGPKAASALLDHLMKFEARRAKSLMSNTSRAALEQLKVSRMNLSRNQQNALTFLLRTMQTIGYAPSRIMSEAASSDRLSPGQSERYPPSGALKPDLLVGSAPERFPPLPMLEAGRRKTLMEHLEEIEDIGMWQNTFEQRKHTNNAVRKMRAGGPELIPEEIKEIESLYERLRQREKDKRK